jgi:hypothetical protein
MCSSCSVSSKWSVPVHFFYWSHVQREGVSRDAAQLVGRLNQFKISGRSVAHAGPVCSLLRPLLFRASSLLLVSTWWLMLMSWSIFVRRDGWARKLPVMLCFVTEIQAFTGRHTGFQLHATGAGFRDRDGETRRPPSFVRARSGEEWMPSLHSARPGRDRGLGGVPWAPGLPRPRTGWYWYPGAAVSGHVDRGAVFHEVNPRLGNYVLFQPRSCGGPWPRQGLRAGWHTWLAMDALRSIDWVARS